MAVPPTTVIEYMRTCTQDTIITRTRTQSAARIRAWLNQPAPRSRRRGATLSRPARRAPWGTISREDVIDAAAEVVSAGGYEEMSIRSLAAGPRCRADVAVPPRPRQGRPPRRGRRPAPGQDLAPVRSRDDWQAWVIQAADKLRHFLVAQPAALHVYLRHPVVSPAAIDRMNAMMDVLREQGLMRRPPAARTAPCTPTPSASRPSKPRGPAGHPTDATLTASAGNSPRTPAPRSSPKACATCSRVLAGTPSRAPSHSRDLSGGPPGKRWWHDYGGKRCASESMAGVSHDRVSTVTAVRCRGSRGRPETVRATVCTRNCRPTE